MADRILSPTTDMLQSFLKLYWFAPPVALWRAVEARAVAQQPFYTPVLDLGCGHGRFAAAVLGNNHPIRAGCDLLHFQLQVARAVGVYTTVAQADGYHLPYPSDAFNTAFSNSVLEHIPDPVPALAQVARTLRGGGRFVVTVPSDHFHDYLEIPRGQSAAAYRAAIDEKLQHYHYHTPGEWSQLFQEVGLQLTNHVYYVAPPTAALWDRMNRQYGIGRRSLFSILVSPRLRRLGYQGLLARLLPRILDRRLRPYFEMELAPDQTGAGLLLVAEKPASA